MNQPQSVETEPKTACHKLRIVYHGNLDVISIEHFGGDGKLLSECRLEPEDALDYAKSIYEVCDEALEVE